ARYTVRLVDASRPGRPSAPDFVEKWVKWGAGLRASQALVRGAKARALMHRRYHVSIKDIQALAKPILRQRVMTNFYAESERSDRYYVKKFEEETNLDCHLMLDISGSMAYGSRAMTKFEYGQCLAAALAYLMTRQRDAVGLMAFDESIVSMLPASSRPGHLR